MNLEQEQPTTQQPQKEVPQLTLKELEARTNGTGQMSKSFAVIFSDLKYGLALDFTNEEACLFAGISQDTFYRWLKESEEFALEMKKAGSDLFREAKKVIAKSIVDDKDAITAKWLLERRRKENYSTRTEQTGEGGKPIEVNISNYTRKELDTMAEDGLLKAAGDQLKAENEQQKL